MKRIQSLLVNEAREDVVRREVTFLMDSLDGSLTALGDGAVAHWAPSARVALLRVDATRAQIVCCLME